MAFLLWHDLVRNAERDPSRPAVMWHDITVTYAELDRRSSRVALKLSSLGIGRSSRVGLYLPKSDKSIISALGVLKCGAAYVPVDPNAPPTRTAYILEDCEVSALVTTLPKLQELTDQLARLSFLKLVILADGDVETARDVVSKATGVSVCDWAAVQSLDAAGWRAPRTLESDPAYLLYTSGSTGNPKGVILSHRHTLTFVEWGAATFHVEPTDRLANHAPLHFDLSVFDIYVALRSGGCVCLVPDEIAPFPVELARWIEERGITVWYSVPSALTRILLHGHPDRYEYRRLRVVLFAGEVFPVKYLRWAMDAFRHAAFFNLYGPTETNVCTYYSVPRPLPDVDEIPIGEACANTEVLILDEDGTPCGPGQSGELYVKGPSLMLGYWGLAEKTRATLVRNPLQPAYDETLYRTGDIVRLSPNGECFFVGRRDHMVKSRGYRIELGEIEQALYRHSAVREAVVIAVPDEEIGARLSAFVALQPVKEVSIVELRSFCLSQLPKYMVPEHFVLAKELPKTSTGKMDRQALTRELLVEAAGV